MNESDTSVSDSEQKWARSGVHSAWPSRVLVACGCPIDGIAAPVFLRQLPEPDGYVMSAIGFQAACRISSRHVAAYLTCGRWEWSLRHVDDVPTVPWRTAGDEYQDTNSYTGMPAKEFSGCENGAE